MAPRYVSARRNCSPDNGDDVTIAALAVAECSAQGTDLDLQVGLLDEGLRPDARDQFVLADHVAGALDQKDENVEGAAAEPHLSVALKQKPLLGKEQELAKRDCASVHRSTSLESPRSCNSCFAAMRSAVPKPSLKRS